MVEDSLKVSTGDNLLVVYNPGAGQFAKEINHLAQNKGANVRMQEEDPQKDDKFLTGLGEDPIPLRMNNTVWADKFAMIRYVDGSGSRVNVDPEVRAAFRRRLAEIADIRVRKERVITALPTRAEAEKELILQSEKTRLIMSIKGQTFANSTIYRNIPGSEVFTGPVRETLEGSLVLPYPIRFAGRTLDGLTLEFKQGRTWDFQTDDADSSKVVKDILGAGAEEVGEVALGTNPVLNRPFLNTLFIEKVSGSFHLALGKAYIDTVYAGREVKVDNGVRSAGDYHIDIARLMLPGYGGGKVIVDGKVIQEDGRFIDPRLKILNPR